MSVRVQHLSKTGTLAMPQRLSVLVSRFLVASRPVQDLSPSAKLLFIAAIRGNCLYRGLKR